MPSPEKILKQALADLTQQLAPLQTLALGQSTIIAQNKQIIELLARLAATFPERPEEE